MYIINFYENNYIIFITNNIFKTIQIIIKQKKINQHKNSQS